MPGNGNELLPNRHRALELLVGGATIAEVSGAVGVHRSTVWKWTQDPVFAGLLRRARAARLFAVQTLMEAATVDAVAYLASAVVDGNVPHPVRLRAALALLDRSGVATTQVALPAGVESWAGQEDERANEAAWRAQVNALLEPIR